MTILPILSLCLFVCIPCTDAYKILLFVPGLSNSQVLFYYRFADLLTSRGHDVTLYVAQYYPNIDVNMKKRPEAAKLIHNIASTEFGELKKGFEAEMFKDPGAIEMIFKLIPMMKTWFKLFTDGCEKQITDHGLMSKLRQENFDLAIGHMYDLCPNGMFRALNINTTIWMSSGILLDYMAWYAGVPSPSSFVPNGMSSMSDKMSFTERFKNLLGVTLSHLIFHFTIAPQYDQLFRQHFGPHFPSMLDLASKAPLIFVNSEELIDFPRPVLHKVIYIGGIDSNQPEPLAREWLDVMENSKKGVVFFSFGSVVNATAMPESWKQAFLEAFSRFPDYTFIWKYEDVLPGSEKVKNLKLTKWAPQKDLLAHPKMKAFITHCGYNSFLESAHNGVPILALPVFGDQMGNFKRAERHGIAVGLKKTEITVDTVSHGLNTILKNANYSLNAKRISSMIKKKPVKPDQLAVGWVEFLAEHKQLPNLQPISADLTLVEYFMLDVAAILLLGLLVVLFMIWMIGNCVLHRCFGKDTGPRKKKSSIVLRVKKDQ